MITKQCLNREATPTQPQKKGIYIHFCVCIFQYFVYPEVRIFDVGEIAAVIEATTALFESLFSAFGKGWTLVLILIAWATVTGFKIHSRHRDGSAQKSLVAEKERTINRIANEAREYKTVVFKIMAKLSGDEIRDKLSDNEIDNLFRKS